MGVVVSLWILEMQYNRRSRHGLIAVLIGLLPLMAGCASDETLRPPEGKTMQTIEIKSGAFTQGQAIPRQYTGDGKDLSPPLAWTKAPPGTASWALICDDPDAPVGTWVHWVLFNLPASARDLPEHVPTDKQLASGAIQGKNDFGNLGYGGPAPPKGKPHRYFFKLFALDRSLTLKPGATKAELLKAMEGHVLGHGELMGTYQR